MNCGRVFAVVADVLDLDAGDDEADDRAGRRHPVVVVAAPDAAVERARLDAQAVLELGDGAAEAVDLGGERGEAVGLVVADVADAGDLARPVGEGGDRDERRGELAAGRQVEGDAARMRSGAGRR